jgi:hypothetical protein
MKFYPTIADRLFLRKRDSVSNESAFNPSLIAEVEKKSL